MNDDDEQPDECRAERTVEPRFPRPNGRCGGRMIDSRGQDCLPQTGGRLFEVEREERAFQVVVVVKFHGRDSAVWSLSMRRSCSFARNKCVFTVPIGTPSTWAISSYCCP